MKLTKDFFARPCDKITRELSGKHYLVRELDTGEMIYGLITLARPYVGRGKWDGKGIFYPPGTIYIYNLYGKPTLNISTGFEGEPACVLIREIKMDDKEIKGPIRVTKNFKIGWEFDGRPITGNELYIDDFVVWEESPSGGPTSGGDYRFKKP